MTITQLMQIAVVVMIPNCLIFAPLAAAEALYDGRSAGRNRVVMAESH